MSAQALSSDSVSRIFFNILGGSLTLLSVQLPWLTINGLFAVSILSNGVYAVMFYWALAGALLSFLSRYGGILTFVGLVAFLGVPYVSYDGAVPGLGILVAFLGAVLTLAGARWSIPEGVVRHREILGGVLYSVGFLIILTLVVSSAVYGGVFWTAGDQLVAAVPLLLAAVLMTGLGLKMFLKDERTPAVLLTDSSA